MTGNDSRPSLWERFVNWETGDESVLDGEIEQSMDQAAPQEAGGEVYASAEKRADDHRTALVEEERSYYSRVHEWSLHKGVKLINRLYRLSAVLVLCFIIFFLMSTVVALPPFGEADNPYNNEVSQRYIEKGWTTVPSIPSANRRCCSWRHAACCCCSSWATMLPARSPRPPCWRPSGTTVTTSPRTTPSCSWPPRFWCR